MSQSGTHATTPSFSRVQTLLWQKRPGLQLLVVVQASPKRNAPGFELQLTTRNIKRECRIPSLITPDRPPSLVIFKLVVAQQALLKDLQPHSTPTSSSLVNTSVVFQDELYFAASTPELGSASLNATHLARW